MADKSTQSTSEEGSVADEPQSADFSQYKVENLFSKDEVHDMWYGRKTISILPNEQLLEEVVLLILTTNDNEFNAVLCYLEPLTGHTDIYDYLQHIDDGSQSQSAFYHIGKYGAIPTAVRTIRPGGEIGGATTAPNLAFRCFKSLNAIIEVGVVYGVETHTKICDVLIADKVINYDQSRLGLLNKGLTISTSPLLSSIFRRSIKWPDDEINERLDRCNISKPKIKQGIILSGSFLTDDAETTKELIQTYAAEAIGIEMETAYLFKTATYMPIYKTIVKAVCDFGDGHRSKHIQPTAALLAANCLKRYFDDQQVLNMLRREPVPDELWTQSELESLSKMTDIPLSNDIKTKILESVIVLLVTGSEIEMSAAKIYLQPTDSTGFLYNFKPKEDQTCSIVYYIGKYGDCPAAVTYIPPALEVHSSTSNVSKLDCQCFCNLNSVIFLSTAYGTKGQVKICDILVSSDVHYDKKSPKAEKDLSEVMSHLLKLLTQSPSTQWPNKGITKRLEGNGITIPIVKCGIIMSGSYSTAQELFIESNATEAKATGIKVKESHLFAETKKSIENIIIVKVVCGYADENCSEIYKPTAALLAADFAHNCLTNPQIYEILAAKQDIRKKIQQAKNDKLTIKVRHAKIMLCGAAEAGKSSFSRLLRNQPHIEEHKETLAGETQQVIQKKVDSNWTDVEKEMEIENLTRIIFQDADKDKAQNDNNDASKGISHDTTGNKLPINNSEENITKQNNHNDHINSINSNQKDIPQKHELTDPVAGIQPSTRSDLSNQNIQSQEQVSTEEEMIKTPLLKLKESIPETWDFFTILDTGGQTKFIKLLPAINDFVDITFIVLDMTCFNDREIYRSSSNKEIEDANIKLIKTLLSTVRKPTKNITEDILDEYIIQGEKENDKDPVIYFIGTHADKLGKNYGYVINKINTKISELNDITNKQFPIMTKINNEKPMYLLPVDNTTRKNVSECTDSETVEKDTIENVKLICNESKELLQDKTVYEIPISWFILELEIHEFCKKNDKVCMSLKEIEKLCDDIMPPHRKMEMDEIKKAMKFYHMFGTLLFYHDVRGLEDVVITNQQWLFVNLNAIVSHDFVNIPGLCKSTDFNDMKNNGICDIKLLKKLNLKLQGVKIESFLNLLQHLKLIAPIKGKYFIPSVLPKQDGIDFDNIFDKQFGQRIAFKANGESNKINSLLIFFKSGTIPGGLFPILVVQLLQFYPNLHSENNDYTCYRYVDAITFQLNTWWHFTLIDRIFYLEVQLRVKEINNSEIKNSCHRQVQKMVTNALIKICENFNWDCIDCSYGFYSKDCKHQSTKKVLDLSEVNQTESINKSLKEVCEQHKIWFKKVKDYPEDYEDNLLVKEAELKELANKKTVHSISGKEAEKFKRKTQILLLAANENENNAVKHFLEPQEQKMLFKYTHTLKIGYLTKSVDFIFGRFGAFDAALHLLSQQGSAAAHDAVIVAADCFGHNLHAIFSVGVACGVEGQNNLLDVVVSNKITCYNAIRYGTSDSEEGKSEKRLRDSANAKTSDFFIQCFKPSRWPNNNSEKANKLARVPKLKVGLILSGDGLIDNVLNKQDLLKQAPDAIGIEMEGAGLIHDQQAHGRQIMIVKGICDFGDGNKDKIHQPTAALLAAECLYYHLDEKLMPDNLRNHMEGIVVLSAPTNVIATALTHDSVDVTWDKLSNATGYIISYTTATSNSNDGSVTVKNGDTTHHTFSCLRENTPYTITMQAIASDDRKSPLSNKVSVTTLEAGIVALSAPTNVIAIALTHHSVYVTWDISSNATGYIISYTTTASNSNDGSVTVKNGDTTHHTFSCLKENTSYTIAMQAIASDGRKSPLSNKVSVTTLAAGIVALSAPTNVIATALTHHSVSVTWDISSNATGYIISYTTTASNNNDGSVTVKNGDTMHHTFSCLKENTSYTIAMQAIASDDRKSPLSNKVSVTTLAAGIVALSAPTNVIATALTHHSVSVTWDISSNATGYIISYTTTASNSNDGSVTVKNGDTTHHTFSCLKENTPYTITMQAIASDDRKSPLSNKVSVTTLAAGGYSTIFDQQEYVGHSSEVPDSQEYIGHSSEDPDSQAYIDLN